LLQYRGLVADPQGVLVGAGEVRRNDRSGRMLWNTNNDSLFHLAANGGLFGAGAFGVTRVVKIAPPAADAPVIFYDGVRNSANYSTAPAGSIAVVFGNNLTDGNSVLGTSIGPDGKVVTTLAGASVKINNVAAPMLYATPTQLAVQIPVDLGTDRGMIEVTTRGEGPVPYGRLLSRETWRSIR
jgi:hypothetical protein